jgi:hypothetical protein
MEIDNVFIFIKNLQLVKLLLKCIYAGGDVSQMKS